MKNYKLQNRYNDDVYLKQIDEHKYELEVSDTVADYVCVNYEGTWGTDNCVIDSIDPSGGPYISRGFKIGEETVTDLKVKDDRYFLYTE